MTRGMATVFLNKRQDKSAEHPNSTRCLDHAQWTPVLCVSALFFNYWRKGSGSPSTRIVKTGGKAAAWISALLHVVMPRQQLSKLSAVKVGMQRATTDVREVAAVCKVSASLRVLSGLGHNASTRGPSVHLVGARGPDSDSRDWPCRRPIAWYTRAPLCATSGSVSILDIIYVKVHVVTDVGQVAATA